MSTTAPEVKSNPGDAMKGFIGSLRDAGMSQAAETAKTEPKPEDGAAKPAATAPTAPPPKPPEVKPAEAAPKEPASTESEEDKWPRSAKDWEQFKAKRKEREITLAKERDEIKTERDKLNAEIETLRKSGPSPELDELKKERDTLSEQLRIVSVENHPKFKAYFENKLNAQIELAKRIVGEEKSGRMVELLKSPDSAYKESQIEEMMAGLTGLQQSRLGGVINALSEIDSERHSEINRSRENFERMQTEEKTKIESRQKEYQSLFDTSVKSAQDPKAGNPAFQIKDGDETWNSDVGKRVDAAKSLLFGQTSPQQLIKAAMDAAAYPAVLRMVSDQQSTIAKLEAQVAELSKAAPSIAGKEADKGSADGGNPVKHKPSSSPQEAVGSWVSGLKSAPNP